MEQKPKTKVRIADSIAGDEPELLNFSFAAMSIVMLPADLAEKWLVSGRALEAHPDEPLYNPMEQKGRRFI